MSLKAYFTRVADYDFQIERGNFWEQECKRLEGRLAIAEKAIGTERSRTNKLTDKFLDQKAREMKLPAVFEEKEPVKVEPIFSPMEDAQIREMAEEMQRQDRDAKGLDYDLNLYIERIKEEGGPRAVLMN